VDPASRLLEVARARAAREGKKVAFRHGEAASLPIGDSSVDVILSVFALIFVPDPGAAAAETSRVLSQADGSC
jgi:ubiquinone/menaquinone biosynthesis C-methylase UbiE